MMSLATRAAGACYGAASRTTCSGYACRRRCKFEVEIQTVYYRPHRHPHPSGAFDPACACTHIHTEAIEKATTPELTQHPMPAHTTFRRAQSHTKDARLLLLHDAEVDHDNGNDRERDEPALARATKYVLRIKERAKVAAIERPHAREDEATGAKEERIGREEIRGRQGRWDHLRAHHRRRRGSAKGRRSR